MTLVNYSDLFNAEGLIISGVYLLLFIFFLWCLTSSEGYDKNDRSLFVALFIIFTVFSFLICYVEILPFFPDTIKFAELVENGSHDSSSLGVRLYVIISYPLRLLAFEQIEVYLVFQIFFYFLSVLLLWNGWKIHCSHMKIYAGNFQVMAILAMLYPAALSFITIPLREFIQVFGFSLFLYGLSQYIYNNNLKWLVIGALLTVFVRPQMVVVYPFLILIAKQYSILKLSIFGLLALPIAILLFENVTGYQFNPAFFSYLRSAANDSYGDSGMTYGIVNWQTYFDVIADLPLLILQFVLSPLPILHSVNPITLKLLLLDVCFVIVILFGACSVKIRFSNFYLKMFLCLIAIFSIWEFYIGGAVRHRFPLIMMLLPLATLYYSEKLNMLLKKR
jgi:hypothetical protein